MSTDIEIPARPEHHTPPEPQLGPIQLLSDREYEVLYLVARGLEPAEISEQLDIGYQTVHSYRYRIMEKLNKGRDEEDEITNNVQLAIFAVKEGIVNYD